jgi:hypothetical protein
MLPTEFAVHSSAKRVNSAFGSRPAPGSWTEIEDGIEAHSVVLLGGSVRRRGLAASVERSLLDLPLTANSRVLDHWNWQFAEFHRNGLDLPFRLFIDGKGVWPRDDSQPTNPQFRVERDPGAYRGTGGLLSDIARQHDFRGWMLVVNAAQVLQCSLFDIYAQLRAANGDIRLLADSEERIVGVHLIRCQTLHRVSDLGYCDFKEQVLPQLREQGRSISVTQLANSPALSLHQREGYLQAVARAHMSGLGHAAECIERRDDGQCSFAVVEDGAHVHSTALIHNSVVLAGARVSAGAAVIESVVCPGGVVVAKQIVRDSVVVN